MNGADSCRQGWAGIGAAGDGSRTRGETIRTSRGRALRVIRWAGAVGFVVLRWLAAVCNVPALCGWLDGASWLLAAVLAAVLLGRPAAERSVGLGRRGSRLLLLTAALNLAGIPLAAIGAEPAWWRSALAGGLDLLAWGWALYGALAAARWLWGRERGVLPSAPVRLAPRHLLLSALIVLVLGLQTAALFKHRPTWWPFIDYPLYGPAHHAPVRTVHYRLHGLTEQEPPTLFEITAQSLGMSWFVYHTQLLPRIFDRPWRSDEMLLRALAAANLAPLRAITAERTTFVLAGTELHEFPELRQVTFDLTPAAPGGRELGAPAPAPAGSTTPQ